MKRYILLVVSLVTLSCSFLHAQQVLKGRNGNIVVKNDSLLRAMTAFTSPATGGSWYSEAVNAYQEALGDNVQVYSMIVPTSTAYYWPENYQGVANLPQRPVIQNMYDKMNNRIKKIDLWDLLERHKAEDIYARTDHHWLPLGAYYAAELFAQVAQVPFRPLSAYDKHVIHRFVGSMARFSGIAQLRQSPEDFVFYTPTDCSYTTTYVEHILQNKQVVGVKPAYEGKFFFAYGDGNGNAYCTFMGGDIRTTHVATGVKNGRRLLVIKDSFGNAIPGYLFYSFADLYVVDFRYFQENILEYIREHKITDLLIVNNIQHAYTRTTARSLVEMLERPTTHKD